jgi:hypothetical protein
MLLHCTYDNDNDNVELIASYLSMQPTWLECPPSHNMELTCLLFKPTTDTAWMLLLWLPTSPPLLDHTCHPH